MLFAEEIGAFDWSKSGPMWAIVATVIGSTLASIGAVMYFFIRNFSASRKSSEERLAANQTSSESNMKDLVDSMKDHVATVSNNAIKESEECRKERKETATLFVQTLREERETYKRSLAELQATFLSKLDGITIVRRLPKP